MDLALSIKQTFESVILCSLFPRSQISIFVNIVQTDGGSLTAALNATTLALMDAGIPMKVGFSPFVVNTMANARFIELIDF